jgi:hypothetical protein
LTDTRLRAMYSAAREGQPFHELVAVHLTSPTAELVLSGKYAETKDPRAALLAMARNLEARKVEVGRNDLKKALADAGRTGNRDLARRLAQLAEAERKGDHELVARIKDSLASDETSSPGKQVD